MGLLELSDDGDTIGGESVVEKRAGVGLSRGEGSAEDSPLGEGELFPAGDATVARAAVINAGEERSDGGDGGGGGGGGSGGEAGVLLDSGWIPATTTVAWEVVDGSKNPVVTTLPGAVVVERPEGVKGEAGGCRDPGCDPAPRRMRVARV